MSVVWRVQKRWQNHFAKIRKICANHAVHYFGVIDGILVHFAYFCAGKNNKIPTAILGVNETWQ